MSGATSPHFSDAELSCHHCGVNNCQQVLVDGLEQLRAKLPYLKVPGKKPGMSDYKARPLIVSDAYRCPIHNAETPNAAKGSEHVQGIAADVSSPGMTAMELYDIAKTIPGVNGIGVDTYRNYIHIDFRSVPYRWNYTADGAWTTWNGVV